MLIIAERINSSRKAIREAIEAHDVEFIQNEARNQAEAGGDYIDVNAGTFVGEEADHMKWMVEAVQEVTDKPLSVDSPDPEVIKAVLPLVDKAPLINSITLEPVRLEGMLPLVLEYKAKVVGLCQSEDSMAESLEDKVDLAGKLVEKVTEAGIAVGDLYIDPLVYPVSTNPESAIATAGAIKQIMENHPGVHTTCGLTNVSYGLPARKLVNRTFLVTAIAHGLDSAILDPTDNMLYSSLRAALAVMGQDQFCMEYITAFRDGRLG